LVIALGACRRLTVSKDQALADCAAIEGEPYEIGSHPEFTRCLVDRYSWAPQDAADAVHARAYANAARLHHFQDSIAVTDSLEALEKHRAQTRRADSLERLRVEREAPIKRRNDSIQIATRQTPYVADKTAEYYFGNTPTLCHPLRDIPEDRRVYFLTRRAAEAAGYRASVLPGCN
jgi:hypothetical protein